MYLSPPTITVFLRGGLGNQLFQWSAGNLLATRFGGGLVLSTTFLPRVQDQFRGVSRWPFMLGQLGDLGYRLSEARFQPEGATSWTSKVLSVVEAFSQAFPTAATSLGVLSSPEVAQIHRLPRRGINLIGLTMDGTSALHASSLLSKRILTPIEPSSEYWGIRKLIREHSPNIAHLRSGDYENLRHLYGQLGTSYWRLARKNHDLSKPLFVFTDAANPEERLRQEGLEADLVIGSDTNLSPVETLSLMTQGSTFTGSNSTFSWWAAALGSKDRPVFLPESRSTHSIRELGSPNGSCTWLITS